MKDLTLKLSRNELMLLTEENHDIRKILKTRNIDPKNIFKQDSQSQLLIDSKIHTIKPSKEQ